MSRAAVQAQTPPCQYWQVTGEQECRLGPGLGWEWQDNPLPPHPPKWSRRGRPPGRLWVFLRQLDQAWECPLVLQTGTFFSNVAEGSDSLNKRSYLPQRTPAITGISGPFKALFFFFSFCRRTLFWEAQTPFPENPGPLFIKTFPPMVLKQEHLKRSL